MSLRKLGKSDLQVSPIGLGTWVTGGWMWGGSQENEAIQAIVCSVKNGINLIDTAPVYGFGKSETIVGKAIKQAKCRDQVLLATKGGLEWSRDQSKIRRNSSRKRLIKEVDDSLKRLQTDVIDLYQIHWPDLTTPIKETMQTLNRILESGKIRAIGVSNYSIAQMNEARKYTLLASLQPPYNLYERGIEEKTLPWCVKKNVGTLTYGALCRGLLSGKFKESASFPDTDIRSADPKFKGAQLKMYLNCVTRLETLAKAHDMSVGQLAILWTLNQPGVTSALVGARNATQAKQNAQTLKKRIYSETLKQIDQIVAEEIHTPIGPEFMAPPVRFSFN